MKKIFISLVLFNTLVGFSQDIHLTQYFVNPTYLNPAFAGMNACSRFSLIHRNQWIGVSTAYKSYLGSFDHYFVNKNIGMGIVCSSDEAGSGSLKTDFVSVAFAYEATLSRTSSLRMALQPGFGSRSINLNKLYFGDQIVRGGDVPTVEQPLIKRNYFDIGTGMVYTNKNYWAGVSLSHFNRADMSFIYNDHVPFYDTLNEHLSVKYSVHMGASFVVGKSERDETKERTFTPAIIYKGQRKFDQVDIGLYYNEKNICLGFWYRGIPVLKAYKPGYDNHDAIGLIIGFSTTKYKIGYSHDITISQLTSKTMGTHEVSMSYQFCGLKKKKSKKHSTLIHCPKF
jgi:type IX secretion system PorP/SprF family membrane protein